MAPILLIQIGVLLIMSKTVVVLNAVEVEEAHEEFNTTMYEKATEMFSSRFKELTASETEEFSVFINKLNKKMANLSSEILGTDIVHSGNLSLANIVEAAGPSGPQMDQLRRGLVDYQQKYVEQVIKTFSLKPEELGLTSEEFCEIFEICPTSQTSSSTPFATTLLSSTRSNVNLSTTPIPPVLDTPVAKSSNATTTPTSFETLGNSESVTEGVEATTIPISSEKLGDSETVAEGIDARTFPTSSEKLGDPESVAEGVDATTIATSSEKSSHAETVTEGSDAVTTSTNLGHTVTEGVEAKPIPSSSKKSGHSETVTEGSDATTTTTKLGHDVTEPAGGAGRLNSPGFLPLVLISFFYVF